MGDLMLSPRGSHRKAVQLNAQRGLAEYCFDSPHLLKP
ncbi:hypothetical protein LMG33818_002035 [Halomonadaceae bacterium LMG 33818]